MAAVAAAFPFIEVKIDTSGLTPIATRSPGVIAIVGKTPDGADGGSAALNEPQVIDTLDQAANLFARKVAGVVTETTLYKSLKTAMLQDPKPSKIYGVRIKDNYAAGLAALEGLDDVTFVSLAAESDIGVVAAGTNPPTNLTALKAHVENMSAQGNKRIGVAMVSPATAKSDNYVSDVATALAPLKSDSSRMVIIAARGASIDAATAAMAAIAGFEPHISTVLKRVRDVTLPLLSQYGPSEIKGLSEAGIIPLIDPAMIVGEGLHMAEGRTFTTDASLLFIDTVRTLDDIDFRLKAGLIGQIGDARITKSGMTSVKIQVEAILGPLLRRNVIAGFTVDIPVLNVLNLPESTWSATDRAIVVDARSNRIVDLLVTVTYGPAVHRLKVTLAPKF
ncbi:MAG: hypothetical protein JSR64_11075 [Nitrospira sp.]|nr:hypothetical protein [Nitrospira sp.]MBX3337181.1 hypothetical protein [Nitrospira sp.]MCW5780191.1 hypothetical protein [Nitrospira sp.]